jgi:hypothetical protein
VRRILAGIVLGGFALAASAQDKTENRELIGKVGTRPALLMLNASERADGSWQVAGEYILLATLARRFVEGERSPELGVTVLKEGTTPILFGRPATGELRGTWREGAYKGTRHGPAGQMREEFEFREEFPSMEDYSARVRCEAEQGRYKTRLVLSVEKGRLKALDWRSIEPDGQACALSTQQQEALRGGLRFVAGSCRITLRDAGDLVVLRAEGCAAHCGAEANLEPLLIDRQGNCEILRLGARGR